MAQRKFEVILIKERVKYPKMIGEKATKLMESLEQKGVFTLASTPIYGGGNDVDLLDISEMKAIYND